MQKELNRAIVVDDYPIYMDERNKERSGWAFRDAPAAASEEVLRAPLLAEQLASNALNS